MKMENEECWTNEGKLESFFSVIICIDARSYHCNLSFFLEMYRNASLLLFSFIVRCLKILLNLQTVSLNLCNAIFSSTNIWIISYSFSTIKQEWPHPHNTYIYVPMITYYEYFFNIQGVHVFFPNLLQPIPYM